MTIQDILRQQNISGKLVRHIICHADTHGISIDYEALTDKDAMFFAIVMDILRDRTILRQVLSKLSRGDKQQLIDTSVPYLLNKAEIYAYSRMRNMLEAGKRIDSGNVLQECQERYGVDAGFEDRIVEIRRALWNQRKYARRKARTP